MAYSDFTLQEVTQRFQLVLDGVRGAACQPAHAVEPLENARILLVNPKVPKFVCPTCLR